MKPSNLITAIGILTENHSNEIIINKSFGSGSNTGTKESPTLHITNCTASAINKLKNSGFALSMNKGFLKVEDYSL